MISKITYEIDSDQVDTTQNQNSHCTQHKFTNDLKPVPKISNLMPGGIQIHRQVPLNDAKISKRDEKQTI